MPNYVAIGQTVVEIWRFFQYGGHPPSWICSAHVWTIYEGHLVVFITVQDLVGIDAAVSIICTFFSFRKFGLKMPIHGPKTGTFGHSNETGAPTATLPNSAQLGGTAYHSPKLHPGLCSSVGMPSQTDRHTDACDQYTFRVIYDSCDM